MSDSQTITARNVEAIAGVLKDIQAENVRLKQELHAQGVAFAAQGQKLEQLKSRFDILEIKVNLAGFGSGSSEGE